MDMVESGLLYTLLVSLYSKVFLKSASIIKTYTTMEAIFYASKDANLSIIRSPPRFDVLDIGGQDVMLQWLYSWF